MISTTDQDGVAAAERAMRRALMALRLECAPSIVDEVAKMFDAYVDVARNHGAATAPGDGPYEKWSRWLLNQSACELGMLGASKFSRLATALAAVAPLGPEVPR